MKIVNLEEFRKLPANTLFSKYQPCVFDSFQIKGETIEFDFYASEVNGAIYACSSDEYSYFLDQAEKTGGSLRMDFNQESRDGFFDKDQLFAVWERADVEGLIERLKECVK